MKMSHTEDATKSVSFRRITKKNNYEKQIMILIEVGPHAVVYPHLNSPEHLVDRTKVLNIDWLLIRG